MHETGLAEYGQFLAHGIGMGHHEARGLRERTKRCGWRQVTSFQSSSDFIHPAVGHVKIEDAVVITDWGCEGIGDSGRELLIVDAK